MVSSDQATQCVWFKRDLRVEDHRPLVEAGKRGPIVALFIIEPEVLNAPDYDALHWQFQSESLQDLQASLADLGVGLLIRRGRAAEVLESVREKYGFEFLWSHEETGNEVTFHRDKSVGKWAKEKGVTWTEFPQNGVVRGLRDRDGWSKLWGERMKHAPLPKPDSLSSPYKGTSKIPVLPTENSYSWKRSVDLRGGETAARHVLESFVGGRGQGYRRKMSSPVAAYDACSRLSPYFSSGCLSIRSAVHRVRLAMGDSIPASDGRSFLSRCHWHCHFMQKLESEPQIENRSFNRSCEGLRPMDPDPTRMTAWENGQTGYPFLDACMRALRTRGWINFRMRAMLVSFAAYDLWIDWRSFRDFLARQFIDYEPGIHFSQIQMQSGVTGINTLRIYSPVKQGLDQDPEGVFVKQWVPELAGLPTDYIHEPWRAPASVLSEADVIFGKTYPRPVVDHKEAVKFARGEFGKLRRKDEFWTEAKRVNKQHGSRKSGERRPKRSKKKEETQQQEMVLWS
ncbi:MAG: deoxyribodipyrimidine photo-lyase [Verrucomicrobiota bacterium]